MARKNFYFYCYNILYILVLLLHISGCPVGPTKPNTPYAGDSYPAALTDLAKKNPLLVQEMEKLPELQGSVTEKEMSAYAWNGLE